MDLSQAIATAFADYPQGTVSSLEEKNVWTIGLSGSIDMRFAKDLQAFLILVIDHMETDMKLVCDMRKVDYICSMGVGTFVNVLVNAKKRNITFLLKDMQPKVKGIFELLGFLSFFVEAGDHA
jgi:anti-anti-sigma factor